MLLTIQQIYTRTRHVTFRMETICILYQMSVLAKDPRLSFNGWEFDPWSNHEQNFLLKYQPITLHSLQFTFSCRSPLLLIVLMYALSMGVTKSAQWVPTPQK